MQEHKSCTDTDISDLALTKAKILTSGIGIDFDAISGEPEYKKEDFTYDSSHHLPLEQRLIVPQELLISDRKASSAVSCINYAHSPYLLTKRDGRLVILDRNTGSSLPVAVELLKQPPFRKTRTSGGISTNRIVSNCGLCEVNVWLWHDCAFYTEHEQCKFCGINSMANQFKGQDLIRISDITNISASGLESWWQKRKDFVISNTVEALSEALKYNFGGHHHLIFTAGSSINTDLQWRIYYDVMKAVDESVVKLSSEDTTIILTPPRDLSLLERIAEFDTKYAFNMEVFDPKLFEYISPGKAKYVTREHYFKAYKLAVELAGEGRVWGGFVLGLEPQDSLIDGIRSLASLGVASGANILHIDHGNTLPRSIRVPTLEEVLSFYKRYGEIVRETGLKPFFCEKAMRTSLNHEAFMGLI
ncbi:MAG: hypothetical protein QXV09_07015 [Candidatus Bathyarchaeia archaeon]